MTDPKYRVRRSKTKPAIIVVDANTVWNAVIGLVCAIAFVGLWLAAWLY